MFWVVLGLSNICLESGAGVIFGESRYLRFSFFLVDSSTSLSRIGSDWEVFGWINGDEYGLQWQIRSFELIRISVKSFGGWIWIGWWCGDSTGDREWEGELEIYSNNSITSAFIQLLEIWNTIHNWDISDSPKSYTGEPNPKYTWSSFYWSECRRNKYN